MNNKRLKEIVQDRKLFGSIDPVEAVLFLTSRYTLLPDVFDIFGRDSALEFLERFGGKTIKVPSIKNVEEAIQQLLIWKALSQDDSQECYRRLSVKFGLKESELRASKQRVQDMFNEQRKRFGRPEQDTEQRSDVDTENVIEVDTKAALIGTFATAIAYEEDRLSTAGLFGISGFGEGEGPRSTVSPGDSSLDR